MNCLLLNLFQEPVEDLTDEEILDLDQHGKLHVLSGGTKVVQHSSPIKTSSGLKGRNNKYSSNS